MADVCQKPGCTQPLPAAPSKVPGGERLCAGHRGVLARQMAPKAAKPAATTPEPAPLSMPDTERMAAPSDAVPEAARPAPIAEATTVTRDPMLASIAPIPNATDVPSAPRVVATSPTPPVLELPDLRVDVPRFELRANALRVYVAASKTLVVRARAAADELRLDERICVGSRWQGIIEEGAEDPQDFAELKRVHTMNIADLRSCDVVLALTCDDAGRGVYGEIGRALEMGKLVVWSLERGGRCQELADERVIEAPTDAQAIQIVRTLAAWRRAA